MPSPHPLRLLAGSSLLVVLAACGSDTGPVDVAPPTPSRIVLDRTDATLELRDSLLLTATALDAQGAALQGVTVTWSSSDPAVARVTPSGWVTGMAGGTARISASVGAVSAAADLVVEPWNIADHAVVVDSTVLGLVGDGTERANGTYRFAVLGAAPSMAVGDVVVGAQSGGFLRRVLAVSEAGGERIVETEPAALSDIIGEGSFEAVIDDLSLDLSGNAPAAPAGAVRWGPPAFHPALPGLELSPSGVISLGGLDVCKELEKVAGASCPSGIKKLQVVKGSLDFGPQFDLQASFSGFSLSSFRGVARGSVTADFDILLEAETSTTLISPQIAIAGITRPFYAQIGPVPVVGYVELSLSGGLEAKATAKGTIQAGYTSTHGIQVGAEWRDAAGWTPVFQNQYTFDAREPSLEDGTLSGQIDVNTKLFLKPEIRIIFYGVVGPFLNVEPYGTFGLTFGTSSCGMDSGAGIDAEIGFTIPFLDPDVGTLSQKNSPWFSWPGRTWTCPLGTLDVTTVTNGSSPDPDGYSILVDARDKGTVGSDAQSVLGFIEVGKRSVRLDGVASNCSVQGDNPVEVTVATGVVTPVPFLVECADPGGDLVVSVTTTGPLPDPDGYTISIDGSRQVAVGVNGSATFSGLATGDHLLAVGDLARNCVVLGPNPRPISVPAGGQSRVDLVVDCTASRLTVTTATSGPPSDTPWRVTLDGAETRSIGDNDQVVFELADGQHSVALLDVADNCVVQGDNPRSVDVSGAAATTFAVTCSAGGLSVTVATTGDPAPATSFRVAAGSTTLPVGPNATVSFPGLPTGPARVELQDLPANCLVQGENPRTVDVPGATVFEVLCQAPLVCVAPPTPTLDEFLFTDWDQADPEPAREYSVLRKEYGHADVTATAYGTTSGFGTVELQVEWIDHLMLIPVDQTRAGESVDLSVDISGFVQATVGGGDDLSRANATVWLPGKSVRIDEQDPSVNWSESATRRVRLGEWFSLAGGANVFVTGHNGLPAIARATASLDRLAGVRDLSGNDVPIVQVCVSSGTAYPR